MSSELLQELVRLFVAFVTASLILLLTGEEPMEEGNLNEGDLSEIQQEGQGYRR